MEEFIQHYGVKGQKWGVRRYQTKSGSLTPAGKKRYGTTSNSASKAFQNLKSKLFKTSVKSSSTSSTSSAPAKKKSVSEMTDEELKKAVSRLELEKRYRDALPKMPAKVSAGQKFVRKLGNAAGDAIVEAGKTVLKEYLTNAGRESLKLSSGKKSQK